MHANYTKRMNIWKFLTPLDSTHLEVFLRILWDFFYFLNSNSNFEFGPVGNRPEPVRTVAPVPRVSGPVPTGSVNPPCHCHACFCLGALLCCTVPCDCWWNPQLLKKRLMKSSSSVSISTFPGAFSFQQRFNMFWWRCGHTQMFVASGFFFENFSEWKSEPNL
jgi:hypothetical protein